MKDRLMLDGDWRLTYVENKRLRTEKPELSDMMEEWTAAGEKIIPLAIRKTDWRDFDAYAESLEVKEGDDRLVPDSTFFCLDTDRNIFVGAVNIRHRLNAGLLRSGGHIGDGIRPSERSLTSSWLASTHTKP